MKKIIKFCKYCRKPFEVDVYHPLCARRKYCSDSCKQSKFRRKHLKYQKKRLEVQKEPSVLFCKYPSCTTVLSQYNKDKNYCLMHQRKILLEQSEVEDEKKLLKSKCWKRLTFWKDSPFFFRNILEGMPRGYSCIAKRKVRKGHSRRVYAVFVRTLQKSKGEYIRPKQKVYLSACKDASGLPLGLLSSHL